ncbi:GPR1/FUN34/yaaH family-domain-containing protein [Podospora conica]|nr:GPR1/FUN34/yaaH family-domain-containing protein [Schizothecium conicum]
MSFSKKYTLRPPIRPQTQPQMPNPYETPMQTLRGAQTVQMSPELFEKLFLASSRSAASTGLQSQSSFHHDDDERYHGHGPNWRKHSLPSPTPIALVGIVICLSPLSCDLMGLLGAGGGGAAGVATYYFFGGLLLLLASLLEYFQNNAFPAVVFASYGAFFFSFAGTLTPSFAAFSSYAPVGADAVDGLRTRGFNASFGWFLFWMCFLTMIFFICSLRTNITLVLIFASLIGTFATLTTSYFLLAANFARNEELAGTLVKAGGVSGLVGALGAWWNLLSVMLETVDFPLRIPLGDLSGWITSASARQKVMA